MRGSSPRMTTCAMLRKNLLGVHLSPTEETMTEKLNRRRVARAVVSLFAALAAAVLAAAPARAADPITIGFGMALTGPLAANGKMSLLAMKIWEEDVNAKGGLNGRPVKLVYTTIKAIHRRCPASIRSCSRSTR